jgi:hypothetical protein
MQQDPHRPCDPTMQPHTHNSQGAEKNRMLKAATPCHKALSRQGMYTKAYKQTAIKRVYGGLQHSAPD